MKICVVGLGYVGMSMSVLLAVKNSVVATDIDNCRVELVNKRISPIVDNDIDEYFANIPLDLVATSDAKDAIVGAKFVIIATPTNYDADKNFFDTSSVEGVIANVLALNKNATIIIKSTVPVGFTAGQRIKNNTNRIIFSPEFLREGHALADNLYPTRIVVGDTGDEGKLFGSLLKNASLKEDVVLLLTESSEAEAIKLFSNTYLALRVAYFNELDTYAECKGLNTKQIIDGMCLDSRIGDQYNNPSFGYGGYCLPKDSKQLLANFSDVPNDIISAVVKANTTRKEYIANRIISNHPKTVGIYRLIMKEGSDNFRESAIQDIIDLIVRSSIDVIIYEPNAHAQTVLGCEIIDDIVAFKQRSDVILANRISTQLTDVAEKVYSRDIYLAN